MNPVLVFPLILALISCGQSHTEGTNQTSDLCYKLCPPGYHKVGTCDDPAQTYKCKKCEDGTFTEIENYKDSCFRCDSCHHYQTVKQPCSFNSNIVCGCNAGYYNSGSAQSMNCKKCTCPDHSKNADHTKKCQDCTRAECQNDPEFRRQCAPASLLTNPPTTITVPTATKAPKLNEELPVLHVVVVATFLLLPWLLLILAMKILRHKDGPRCWSKSKDAEDPKNEQPSHQGSNPTTLTLTVSEETPMMLLTQSPSERSTYIGRGMPVSDHIASRQDDQSDYLPAIVLYAIINEVPLHRWKEFLRLLKVADQQMARVELETGFSIGSMEKQYQMLRLWSQSASAKLSDVFSALHYMDLSGCAQLLQERLEKLQWRPEQRQAFTAF